jgi:2-alkenal reductase
LLKKGIILLAVTIVTIVFLPKFQLFEISATTDINTNSTRTPSSGEKEQSIEVYKNVNDSVVRINVISQPANEKITINDVPIKDAPGWSWGSGFIYDSSGKIVTNYHVIEDAQLLYVTLSNGNSYVAKVIGEDRVHDLAVVQIDQSALSREKLMPLAIADPATIHVGQVVVAIGSPLGFTNSLTEGIVSHIGRIANDVTTGRYWVGGLIQTDAAINHGNSGGPLLNLDGEVVGVNEQIRYDQSGSIAPGIGLAISGSIVKKVVPYLISEGKYQTPWIGIGVADVTPFAAKNVGLNQTRGVLVLGVTPGSPAAASGIEPGDIILGVDNLKIKELSEIIEYLGTKIPGNDILLTVLRSDGTNHIINFPVGKIDTSANEPSY